MKDAEDEAFDDIARRQGAWGGGYRAKRAAAADKYSDIVSDGGLDPRNKMDAQPAHCQCTACKDGILHSSDCAVHNGPAYPAGECDCGVAQEQDWKTLPPKDAPLVQWAKEQTAPPQPVQETAQLAHIAQFIKELRPAIGPMATMGKSKTTQEWFDIVINEIERLQAAQEKNT